MLPASAWGQTAARLAEIGPNDFRITHMGADHAVDFDALDPAVAYNRTASEFLVVWAGPALAMAFVVQCTGGAPNGSVNAPWFDNNFFPMDCRFTWVVVAPNTPFVGWEPFVGPDRPILTPLGTPYVNAYNNNVQVTMSTGSAKAQIRYTLNGAEPNANSMLYTGPINVNMTRTIKAKTFKAGLPASDTTSMRYVVN